ncbi:hypothetical protein PCE1_003190 [Barthelona sp. PCE]
MRVKVLSRSKRKYTSDTKEVLQPIFHSKSKEAHPFLHEREYVRALNSTKLDKTFAKPLIGALESHTDSIWCLQRHPIRISTFFSGACDGDLVRWNISARMPLWTVKAHQGFVRGVALQRDGDHVLTCSDDCTVKMWEVDQDESGSILPVHTWISPHSLRCVDCNPVVPLYATGDTTMRLWDVNSTTPIQELKFDMMDGEIAKLKFAPSEPHLVLACDTQRSMILYDTRAKKAIRRLTMKHICNDIDWNPQEPVNFIMASMDGNVYSFDMRNFKKAKTVHKDHMNSVQCCRFSPTGREFVSGSFDRTLRIWNSLDGRSRDVYHTRRMQRLFSVEFSGDGRFVLSGSDDTNIRIWKTRANMQVKPMVRKERVKINYENQLKKKFGSVDQIRNIRRAHKLPKALINAKRREHIQLESVTRKDRRRVDNGGRKVRQKEREAAIYEEGK